MTFFVAAIASSVISGAFKCVSRLISFLTLTLFLAWCSFLDQNVQTIYSTLNKIQVIKYDSKRKNKSRQKPALNHLLTYVEGSSTHVLSFKRFHCIFGIFIVLVIYESVGPLEDKQSKKVSEAEEEARHAASQCEMTLIHRR